jgi:hypothetical protein
MSCFEGNEHLDSGLLGCHAVLSHGGYKRSSGPYHSGQSPAFHSGLLPESIRGSCDVQNGTQEVFSLSSSAFPWHSGSFFSEFFGFPLALRKFSLRVLRLSPGTQEVFSQSSSAFPWHSESLFSEFFSLPLAVRKFSLRFLRLSPDTQEVFSQNSSAFPWHSGSFLSDFFGFRLSLRKFSLRVLRLSPVHITALKIRQSLFYHLEDGQCVHVRGFSSSQP